VKASPAPKAAPLWRRPGPAKPAPEKATPAFPPGGRSYTAWTFGELPELMEVRKGGTSLVGFPALIDEGDAVTIEVFDEPEVAAAKHRAGLRRLFALQLKDALKYLEKNIPDLQKMAVAFMPLGTQEELREQIIDVALDRAFLLEPLPADEFATSSAGWTRAAAA
jgi:ATP-dependent helicase HrpA